MTAAQAGAPGGAPHRSLGGPLFGLARAAFARLPARVRAAVGAVVEDAPPPPADAAAPPADHAPQFVPPGHFYSPIPDLREVRAREGALFDRSRRTLPGVDLREAEQLALLEELAGYYAELPFAETKREGLRYYYENPAYSYSDAIFLYGMLRHARPRRVIEVGSGFSSCVILDTRERFLGGEVECTFIEPYPDLLRSLLGPDDARTVTIVPTQLQAVPLETFTRLEANDVLFIDSTHVSKVGSDVNAIVFEILPALRPGVLVHFHDVFFPFEYPADWIYEGRTWQEAYLLRAFLAFNSAFEVVAFNTFLAEHHRAWFERHMPLCLRNPGGSLWIRRVP